MEDDIARAIHLSLIKKTDEEEKQLHDEIEKILAFVREIQEVETEDETLQADKRVNVFRDDMVTVAGGTWREKMLDQAPARLKNGIATKRILQ